MPTVLGKCSFLSFYLKCAEAKENDADSPVSRVSNARRIASKLKTGGPSGNTHNVGGGLAGNVEVEPGGVGGFENPHVPCQYGSYRHQYAPANRV